MIYHGLRWINIKSCVRERRKGTTQMTSSGSIRIYRGVPTGYFVILHFLFLYHIQAQEVQQGGECFLYKGTNSDTPIVTNGQQGYQYPGINISPMFPMFPSMLVPFSQIWNHFKHPII